jgi:hypothetical protein
MILPGSADFLREFGVARHFAVEAPDGIRILLRLVTRRGLENHPDRQLVFPATGFYIAFRTRKGHSVLNKRPASAHSAVVLGTIGRAN